MPEEIKKSKGGAPRKVFDFDQLEILCQYPCSAKWAADFFKITHNTLKKRVLENTGLTWDEFNERCMAPTRFALMQAAVDQAKAGNGKALAMCLSKFCDWDTKKKPDISITNNVMSDEQLNTEIAALLKEMNLKL